MQDGSAMLRFNCGAMVTLDGPSRFRLLNAKHGYIESGKLTVSIPHEAIGFRIDSPAMQLTDLGTEFAVDAAPGGETEVHVLHGTVKIRQKGEPETAQALELREDEARRFAKPLGSVPVELRREFGDMLFDSRPSQRLGIYTFDSSGTGTEMDPWITDPSAKVVAGGDVRFHDFHYQGVRPGPVEYEENLNRWSFKSWRPDYQMNYNVGFKVEAQGGKVLRPNRLTLELFRAGGLIYRELAPQDGVLRVSSDGFETYAEFVLMEGEAFVLGAKFVTVDVSGLPPAPQYAFRFLFKGTSKARAIRLDEVTLDVDVD
jgi:hypothetical protein